MRSGHRFAGGNRVDCGAICASTLGLDHSACSIVFGKPGPNIYDDVERAQEWNSKLEVVSLGYNVTRAVGRDAQTSQFRHAAKFDGGCLKESQRTAVLWEGSHALGCGGRKLVLKLGSGSLFSI